MQVTNLFHSLLCDTVVCYQFMIFITNPQTVQYDEHRTANLFLLMNLCLFINDLLNLKLNMSNLFTVILEFNKPNEAAICVVDTV